MSLPFIVFAYHLWLVMKCRVVWACAPKMRARHALDFFLNPRSDGAPAESMALRHDHRRHRFSTGVYLPSMIQRDRCEGLSDETLFSFYLTVVFH